MKRYRFFCFVLGLSAAFVAAQPLAFGQEPIEDSDGAAAVEAIGRRIPDLAIEEIRWQRGEFHVVPAPSLGERAADGRVLLVFVDEPWSEGNLALTNELFRAEPMLDAFGVSVVYVLNAPVAVAADWEAQRRRDLTMIWEPGDEVYKAAGLSPGLPGFEGGVYPIFLVGPDLRVEHAWLDYNVVEALEEPDAPELVDHFVNLFVGLEGFESFDAYAAAHPDKAAVQAYMEQIEKEREEERKRIEEAKKQAMIAEQRERAQERFAEFLAMRDEQAPKPTVGVGDTAPDFRIPVVSYNRGERITEWTTLDELTKEQNVVVTFMFRLQHPRTPAILGWLGPQRNEQMMKTNTALIVIAPVTQPEATAFRERYRSYAHVIGDPDRTLLQSFGVVEQLWRRWRRSAEHPVFLVGPGREVLFVETYYDPDAYEEDDEETDPLRDAIDTAYVLRHGDGNGAETVEGGG